MAKKLILNIPTEGKIMEKNLKCCNCLPYDSEKNYDTKFMHE